MIRPSIECVDMAALIILAFCHGPYTCTVHSMPVFEPNDYLFETHKDKGKEKWEIFGWALRDAMSKASNLPTHDQPLRSYIGYYKYLLEGAKSWKLEDQPKPEDKKRD